MPRGGAKESKDRERERAAIMGLALSQLANEDVVRAEWEVEHGATFPTLEGSLRTLAELTSSGRRRSHRTFSLQLLAKVARQRGTDVLAGVLDDLLTYVQAQIVEGDHIAEVRAARRPAPRARPRQVRPKKAATTATAADKKAAAAARAKAKAATQGTTPPKPVLTTRLVGGPVPPTGPVPPRGRPRGPSVPMAPPRRRNVKAAAPMLTGLVDINPRVQRVFNALNAAATSSASTGTAWQIFATEAGKTLHLSKDELALPMCSDQEHVEIGGHDSTRVVTWFATAKPAADFAHWTDPRLWHLDCSLFYDAVTPTQSIPKGQDEFSVTFTEVVRFTATKVLTTPLVFTRTVAPPNLYAVHFALPPGVVTNDILVDTGSLIARHDADLPPEVGTQMTAEKCIAFADPAMVTWPSMCCDLFWTELSITVALGCAQDGN